MIRKAAVILFVVLLATQPLVMLTSFAANEVGTLNIDNSSQLAQEAGSRLDPLDYTNHVPVIIDEVSDWTSQAWPGAGTSGDPYIISGLRIHYDLSLPLIQVTNQDAYFIVRDCMLIQNSTTYAVEFQNTTHAMIEYTTIYSEDVGIYGNNANNTIIDHVFGEGSGASDYTVSLNGSLQVTITNCEFNSLNYRAILTTYCHSMTLTSNTLEGNSIGFENRYSNYTSCTDLMVTGPDTSTGVLVDECYYATYSEIEVYDCGTGFDGTDAEFITLTDSSFYATNTGIDFYSSLNITMSGCYVSAWDGVAAIFGYCYYSMITGNTFTNDDASNTLSGVLFAYADNSTIDGNFFLDFGYTALHIDVSLSVMITNNYFEEMDHHAIYLDFSNNITLTNNEYYRSGYDSAAYVVYIENSDYTTIRSEYMEDIFCASIVGDGSDNGLVEDCWLIGHPEWVGVGFFNGENWTIQDNHIEGNWKAFTHLSFGVNLKVYRNTLVDNLFDTGSIMIQLMSPIDAEVINNTLTNCAGNAMSITGGQRSLIEGNVITNTYQGIYCTVLNTTIIGNTLQNIEKRAIDGASVINMEILNNDIDGSEYGLYLNTLTTPLISGNTIQNSLVGMHYVTVLDAIIENNELTDCGFSFQKQQGYHTYNHTVSNNLVNGLPFYYSVSGNGLSLDADDWGQIMLLNATNSAITNGEITNSTYGIILVVGDQIDITSVVLSDHYEGALFDRSYNVTLEDCVFSNSHFIAHLSHDFVVDNVSIQGYTGYSSLTSIQNFQIVDSRVIDDAYGIYIFDSQDGLVEGSQFFGCEIGIEVEGASQDIEIIDNEIKWCVMGISGDTTSNINVTLNYIHDNGHGIHSELSTNWRITNNTIFANFYTGLTLDQASSPFVTYNEFMNLGNNGWETTSTNFWDDGVDTGNYWYENPLVTPYPIGGFTGSTDRYPMGFSAPTEPMLNEPKDEDYAEFSEGNELEWIVADDNPRDWEVRIDGTLWDSDAWDFEGIVVNIDGLSYGVHTVDLIVWDLSGNNATDSVLVTVFDDTDPTINEPDNLFIFVGVPGNEILWDIADQNPDRYEVYRDDVLVTSGDWWSSAWTYSYSLAGLAEGTYLYTLTIYDVDDNSASDSVMVYIRTDDVDPIINHPNDYNMTEGTTGNFLIWSASDEFPSHYTIVENSSVVGTGNWGGSTVSLLLDNLPAGYYTFTVTVFDEAGNTASDAVNVTVIPVGGWPPVPLPDFTLAIIAVIGAAGAVIVIVVVVFTMRKKKAGAA